MKPVTFLLCFLLCIIGTRPACAYLAVPFAASPEERASSSGPETDAEQGSAKDSVRDDMSTISLVTQTVAGLKAARTMKAASATGVSGTLSGIRISTTIVPMSDIVISTIMIPGSAVTLSQLAASYRPRSGFFFESPDAPGSQMRLMTITPSAPEIRILSPYQSDDPRDEVPLPSAVLLLATGLAACLTAGKRNLFRSRFASPAS
jgi:hypothetical protein